METQTIVKQKEIKISVDLDFVYLKVDGKTDTRWPMKKDSDGSISAIIIMEAKAAAFDLLWKYEEIKAGSAKIVPYLN